MADSSSGARPQRRVGPPWVTRATPITEPRQGEPDELFVEAFSRGLAVIRSFANRQRPLTIAEVSRRAGVSRSAARRLLHTLVTLGYAAFDEQGFTLLPKTLMLGSAFLSSDALVELGQPVVTQLAASTHAFCSLNVLQGDESLLVCMSYLLQPSEVNTTDPTLGMGAPLYCSASGLVFLSTYEDAQLDDYFGRVERHAYTYLTVTDPGQLRQRLQAIREQGFAVVDREMSPSLRAISVPVRDRSGRVIAALVSMATPHQAPMTELIEEWVPRLLTAAAALSARL